MVNGTVNLNGLESVMARVHDIVSAFVWKDLGKPWKFSEQPAKAQSGYVPFTNKKYYPLNEPNLWLRIKANVNMYIPEIQFWSQIKRRVWIMLLTLTYYTCCSTYPKWFIEDGYVVPIWYPRTKDTCSNTQNIACEFSRRRKTLQSPKVSIKSYWDHLHCYKHLSTTDFVPFCFVYKAQFTGKNKEKHPLGDC